MDVLILSCGTGGGHNAAAAALEEKLLQQGHRVTRFNPYDLHSQELSSRIDQAYIGLVKRAPKLFGALYTMGALYRRLPFQSPVYHLNGKMAPLLEEYLRQHKVDVILMTHIFPGQILTHIRRKGIAVPKTVLVATDYTCIPFAEECECDAYVVPSSALVEEFASWGIPRERIYPLGIPVAAAFSGHMTRAEAKAQLGLDPAKHYVLVASGSMGAGRPEKTLEMLQRLAAERPDVRIVTICGNNDAMADRLRRKFGDRMDVVGQTNQMALYLRACELYLTKPGGLSTTEAAVSGAVLGLLATIPGCETHNLNFFEKKGMCRRVEPAEESLEHFLALLDDSDARERMIACQHKHICPNAAERISHLAGALAQAYPRCAQRPYSEGPMPLHVRSW